MNETLRPLSLGEILDRTVQLYRQNFMLFVGVAAVPMLALVSIFAGAGVLIAMYASTIAKDTAPFSSLTGVLVVTGLVATIIPLAIATTAFSQGALANTAFRRNLGEPLRIRTAIKSVWPRLGRFVWLMILQAVFIGILPFAVLAAVVGLLVLASWALGSPSSLTGFFTFLVFLFAAAAVVTVVFRAIEYAMAFAVCVAEDKTAWASLTRAKSLSKGTRGRIFVMFLLIWALAMVLSLAAYVPFLIVVAIVTALVHNSAYAVVILVVTEILNVILSFSMQTLLAPVYTTALVLFYFDQRVRTEGYDIERMMEQAGLTERGMELHLAQATHLAVTPDTLKEI